MRVGKIKKDQIKKNIRENSRKFCSLQSLKLLEIIDIYFATFP